MITRQGAFILGYTVPIVGVHFNASEVLALAERGATEALMQRIEQHVNAFAARAPKVVENVKVVLELLKMVGIDAGPPPRMPPDYPLWAEAIDKGWAARTGGAARDQASIALDAARLFGHAMGDALLTLNVAALVEHLRAVAPGHQWLLGQARALAEDEDRSAGLLARAADNPLLPPGAHQPFKTAAGVMRDCTRAGGANPEAAINAIQKAMRAIAEQVPGVEGAFARAGG